MRHDLNPAQISSILKYIHKTMIETMIQISNGPNPFHIGITPLGTPGPTTIFCRECRFDDPSVRAVNGEMMTVESIPCVYGPVFRDLDFVQVVSFPVFSKYIYSGKNRKCMPFGIRDGISHEAANLLRIRLFQLRSARIFASYASMGCSIAKSSGQLCFAQ